MSEKYRTTSFYNGVSSFKAAFPDLADAFIEWREQRGPGGGPVGEVRKTGHRRGNFTQGVLPCSNLACHEGGYQVDRLIAEMVSLGETERQGVMLCSGREIAEEVRRGPVRCTYRIDFKATLSPRSEDEPPRPERRPFRRGRNRSRRNTAA
jgi:hypothetical protein